MMRALGGPRRGGGGQSPVGEEEREEDVAEELVEDMEHWRMRAQLSLMSMEEFGCNKE